MSAVQWVKEHLFRVGLVLIVAAAVFVCLFVLTDQNVGFMAGFVSFTAGFLVSGFASLLFGFVFCVISCYVLSGEPKTKTGNTSSIRAVLVAVTALYLFLLAYSISADSEWLIRSLILENVAGVTIEPSYAFYPAVTVSTNNLFYATMIVFGIFVLPVALAEAGLLDDKDGNAEEQPVEGEESFNRFVAFLKRHLGSRKLKAKKITRIRRYIVPVSAAFVALGACFIGLPPFLVKDGPLTVDPETGVEFVKDYMGVLRGQFLLLGILFIVVGVVLVARFRKNQNRTVD